MLFDEITPTAMTLLSVNLNKIAVLRNSRGGSEPDICRAAQTCIDAGLRRHHRASAAGPAPCAAG